MDKDSNNNRKNYLIDKSFQVNFIVKFIVLIVACALITGILLSIFYYIKYDMVINDGKEILIKYINPETLVPKKVKVTANTKILYIGNKRFSVLSQNLLYADIAKKTLHPTFEKGRFRIRENAIQKFNRNTKEWLNINYVSKNYVVKKGQLGEMTIFKGKQKFSIIRIPVNPGQSKFKPNAYIVSNVKGVTDRSSIVIFALLIATLIFVITTSIFGVFFSHRLAGPIYRIGISMDRIAKGDLDFQVRLRKTDAFQHLAQKLNHLVSGIKSGKIKSSGKKKAVKTPVKKAPAKKAASKKTVAKKAVSKKAPAKKTAAKKEAPKKTVAKKAPAKKAAPKKTAAKKKPASRKR